MPGHPFDHRVVHRVMRGIPTQQHVGPGQHRLGQAVPGACRVVLAASIPVSSFRAAAMAPCIPSGYSPDHRVFAFVNVLAPDKRPNGHRPSSFADLPAL